MLRHWPERDFSFPISCLRGLSCIPRLLETITHAYFFLIRERMARAGAGDWEEFVRGNPDLLTWKDGILSRYYNQATLESDLARRIFLLPDKANFNPDESSRGV